MTDQNALAQIGVVGLAVMGSNIARNFARHGYTVAVYNRSTEKTDAFMAEYGKDGDFIPSTTIKEFVASLERPRRALIMVQAGEHQLKMNWKNWYDVQIKFILMEVCGL